MSFARQSTLPLPHMLAELAAAAFATREALEEHPLFLDPLMKSKPTIGLWRRTENRLLQNWPSMTIDELANMRDMIWFDSTKNKNPLEKILENISCFFIDNNGCTVCPTSAGESFAHSLSPAELRTYWRWFSYALPPDLLLAAHPKNCPPCCQKEMVSPYLSLALREKGFAQLHLHLGAGRDFCDHWVLALIRLADPDLKKTEFHSPGAEFEDGRDLGAWLIRAASIRSCLAAFLVHSPGCNLETFFSNNVLNRLHPGDQSSLVSASADLLSGKLNKPSANFSALRRLYENLTWVRLRWKKWDKDNIQEVDPIAAFFPARTQGSVTPEMNFMSAALSFIRQNREDYLFSNLFWQVVRIRCLFYRHVIQRPLTRGLQWFFRFYDRIDPSASLGMSWRIKEAARLEGAGKGLLSLEYRTAPQGNYQILLKKLERPPVYKLKAVENKAMEMGLVLHFVKSRGGQAKKGLAENRWQNSNADPASKRNKLSHYRYSDYYKEKRKEALATARILLRYPLSLLRMRSMDTCTDELGVPSWILAPLFSVVREASKLASAAIQRYWGLEVPSFRATAHAGEDFVHLLGGLRRIDEAVEYFNLGEGDRIGHALALGTDPENWAKRVGYVALAKEERLFDLLWEWQWYANQGADIPDGQRPLVLQKEIYRLSKFIFGKPLEAVALSEMIREIHNGKVLRALGFPNGRDAALIDENPVWWNFARAYLTSQEVFQRGRDLEWVDANQDVASMEALQRGLCTKIARIGLTIETNPSSNLLIGDLSDFKAHPLWRLTQPEPMGSHSRIRVAVCSDDPLTFATCLPHEYQYLLDALVSGGHAEADAEKWIDMLRAEGLTARFTLPESIHAQINKLSRRRGWTRQKELKVTDWTVSDLSVEMPP